MLIHHEDGRWIALTAVCTHLGCTVQYEPQADRIHCACHGGVYNPYTGANVSGPPPKPLKLFKVAVNDTGVAGVARLIVNRGRDRSAESWFRVDTIHSYESRPRSRTMQGREA